MDLQEQNELAIEVESVLKRKLRGKEFHALVVIDDYGVGRGFSLGTLSEQTVFQSCRLIVDGISEEAGLLAKKFKIPSGAKLKRPVEPKR